MSPPDTIAALSTAAGPAARMILRLSGPSACEIAGGLCHVNLVPARPVRAPATFRGLVVPVTLYPFRGPRSYTGEDLVEFHLPGNPLLAQMLLDALIAAGARHAEPGEFTARAYFNGRLDLTEAEGVAATIAAQNESELRAARQLMSGELARRLSPVMELVAETLALTEVGIDFSEEDVSFLSADEAARRIERADAGLKSLVEESARFERLAHEPRVVLVGRPNAGKSTLLNALAGRERAVVSPVAGTTRDALSAEVPLRRGLIRLVDVAGLEPAGAGVIDGQMQARALREVEAADLLVLVRDAASSLDVPGLPRPADLTVFTKTDLAAAPDEPGTVGVCARTGENLDALRRRLDDLAFGPASDGSTLALNARHLHAIADARAALARANGQVRGGAELLALELRDALDALGRVLGSVSPDDVLGRIFSGFCIGK